MPARHEGDAQPPTSWPPTDRRFDCRTAAAGRRRRCCPVAGATRNGQRRRRRQKCAACGLARPRSRGYAGCGFGMGRRVLSRASRAPSLPGASSLPRTTCTRLSSPARGRCGRDKQEEPRKYPYHPIVSRATAPYLPPLAQAVASPAPAGGAGWPRGRSIVPTAPIFMRTVTIPRTTTVNGGERAGRPPVQHLATPFHRVGLFTAVEKAWAWGR